MKSAFIIRGFRFGASAADPDYAEISETVRDCGYTPIPVPWIWNYKTMSQYTNKFVDFYNERKGEINIIIGHSFGAMVAFLSSPKLKPDLLVLCSLSAYFKEDLDRYTDYDWIIKNMGKRRREDFKTLSADDTANTIRRLKIPTAMIVGENERYIYPRLYARVYETATRLKPYQFIEVIDTDHTIFEKKYLRAIRQTILI